MRSKQEPVELGEKDIKEESLKILKYIKEICTKNNIRYYLGYGSAIGAVRHKGFIPWDDDIDILMFRSDYIRFREVMSREDGRYKLADISTDTNYFLIMPKVYDTRTYSEWPVVKHPFHYGVWVDIFLLDNAPDSIQNGNRFYSKLTMLQEFYNYSIYKHERLSLKEGLKPFFKRLIFSWTSLLGSRHFVKQIDALSQRYNNVSTEKVTVNMFHIYKRREDCLFERGIFGEGVNCPFEDDTFSIPCQYDKYLRTYYGDYMQLPPEEKRVSHHSIRLYYKD